MVTDSDIKEVFNHWVRTFKKSSTITLSSAREQKIRAALEEFPLETVLQAIDGTKNSPYNMGNNPQGKPYNDLTTILRDQAQIIRLSKLAGGTIPEPDPIPGSEPNKDYVSILSALWPSAKFNRSGFMQGWDRYFGTFTHEEIMAGVDNLVYSGRAFAPSVSELFRAVVQAKLKKEGKQIPPTVEQAKAFVMDLMEAVNSGAPRSQIPMLIENALRSVQTFGGFSMREFEETYETMLTEFYRSFGAPS